MEGRLLLLFPSLRPGMLTPLQEVFLRRFFTYDVGQTFFLMLFETAKQKYKGLIGFYLAGMMRQVHRVKDLSLMLEPVDLEALVSFYDELADRLLARHRSSG